MRAVLLLCCYTLLCTGDLAAQQARDFMTTWDRQQAKHRAPFGQHAPPFAREAPAERTYEFGDTMRVELPDYALPGRAFGPTLLDIEERFVGIYPNEIPTLFQMRGGPQFDFSRSLPHLAFFCRLEINEAAGSIIPAKFRLGGHRYWQDNLLR